MYSLQECLSVSRRTNEQFIPGKALCTKQMVFPVLKWMRLVENVNLYNLVFSDNCFLKVPSSDLSYIYQSSFTFYLAQYWQVRCIWRQCTVLLSLTKYWASYSHCQFYPSWVQTLQLVISRLEISCESLKQEENKWLKFLSLHALQAHCGLLNLLLSHTVLMMS